MANTQWYQIIDTSKKFKLGTQKKDVAGNVYVYASGVASTAVGDAVVIDNSFATVRLTTSVTNAFPVGVAMAANTSATNYSWYQVFGVGSVTAAGTVASGAKLQATATAGQVDDTTTAGQTVVGMVSAAAGSAATAMTCILNFPIFEGGSAIV